MSEKFKKAKTTDEAWNIQEQYIDKPHFPEHDFDSLLKSLPHKTYRILDSLDGIPLDTRIPLSEWIPPFGVEVTIISDKNLIGKFRDIRKQGYVFYEINTEFSVLITDGHWMRIV